MLNVDSIKNKVKNLYHLCCILNKYTQSLCNEAKTEEGKRIAVFAEYITDIADDLYYEFIKSNE